MQVFYVKDMANKPKKNQGKSDDEPKRHIVLPGKRKIIRVEDISDKSEDFDQFDDCPPFSVDVAQSSCYPKRMLLIYAAITTKGRSSKGKL